jgi:hypothetical protein
MCGPKFSLKGKVVMIRRPEVGDRCWHVDPKSNRIRLVVVDCLDNLPTVSVLVAGGGDRLEVMRKNLFRSYQAAMIQTYVNHANAGAACV